MLQKNVVTLESIHLGGTEKLVAKLSKYLKVPSNMVGVGNGSDQILDLFLANFCTRKTRILTSEPTFAFFEERCKLYGVKMIKVQFSEWHDIRR